MLANCNIIVIFTIYGQFGAIQEQSFRLVVRKFYIFINSNFLSYKKLQQN